MTPDESIPDQFYQILTQHVAAQLALIHGVTGYNNHLIVHRGLLSGERFDRNAIMLLSERARSEWCSPEP